VVSQSEAFDLFRRWQDRHICGSMLTSLATEARVVVARIKVDPSAFKKDLIPCAEISRAAERLANISDIAGDIARWNIHAAGQGDRQMLKISADADSLDEDIRRGFGRSRG
jgi:hypothetical protein